ncbi:hypothetical protein [Tepidicaulis marinus]|nr:hypothetical protein [Tepidicaulis marinus]
MTFSDMYPKRIEWHMTEKHTISYQDLWDYLDGLLDTPQARQVIEATLMRDEALAAEFSLMRAQHRVLTQTSASVEHEAVPERLLEVIRRARGRCPGDMCSNDNTGNGCTGNGSVKTG